MCKNFKGVPFFTRIIAMVVFPSMIYAVPKVTVDSAEFDIGTIIEGKNSVFSHTFKLTNTGDSPLTISQVRKSCGCTSVSFDSVIQPGATGLLTETVTTEKAYPGKFTMPIIVISNARNTPILRLSINGTYKLLIKTEPISLTLIARKGLDTGAVLTLKTTEKSFKVTGVSFDVTEKKAGFSWNTILPMNYTFALVDSAREKHTGNGSSASKKRSPEKAPMEYVYKLRIKLTKPEHKGLSGDFVINTNLPEKPEIRIFGILVVD